MKSGVVPCVLTTLLEGSCDETSFFTQIVAQCMNRTPMNNCCHPLREEACCSSC